MTGLRERGYIEGQSIIIEYRSAQGSEKRLSEIAAELVRLKPDVIVANGNSATDAAKRKRPRRSLSCLNTAIRSGMVLPGAYATRKESYRAERDRF